MCYCLLFLVSTLCAPAQMFSAARQFWPLHGAHYFATRANERARARAAIIIIMHTCSLLCLAVKLWFTTARIDSPNATSWQLRCWKPPDSRPHCTTHIGTCSLLLECTYYYNWLLWLRYHRQDVFFFFSSFSSFLHTTSVVNKNDVVVAVVGVLLLPYFFLLFFFLLRSLLSSRSCFLPVSSTRRRCFVVFFFFSLILYFLFFAFAFLFVCVCVFFDILILLVRLFRIF